MSSLRIAFDEVHTLLTTLAYDMEERLMEPPYATAASRVVLPLLDASWLAS